MLKPAVAALCLAGALAATALAQTPPAGTPPQAPDPVVARVNGAEIRLSEVEAVRDSLPPQYRQLRIEVLFPLVVERLIDQRLVTVEARRQNLQDDAEIRQRVAAYEDELIQTMLLTRAVVAAVTDQTIRARYDQMRARAASREEFRARHILVQQEAQAREIIRLLAGGADFAELARTRSIDPGGRRNGGDLGFFGEGEMVPEFFNAVRGMQPGETSREPVRSQFGWHVIRVEEKRTGGPPLEELRDQIVNDLQQEAVDAYLRQLRQEAQIEVLGPEGGARPQLQMMPQPAPAPVAPGPTTQPRR